MWIVSSDEWKIFCFSNNQLDLGTFLDIENNAYQPAVPPQKTFVVQKQVDLLWAWAK